MYSTEEDRERERSEKDNYHIMRSIIIVIIIT